MWIFYVNYPNNRRNKINILIIEDRKLSGIDEWGKGSIKHYIRWLFRAGWIRENFVGFKKEAERIILHMRGDRFDIKYMLEVLSGSSHEFEIKQRSLTVHKLGYFKNAPYYWMRIRGHGSCEAYKKALDKVIPHYRKIEYE